MFQNAPSQEPVYRKVAIVENFFDIIYTVHVELEGRPGKHAGQKRTYRTVSDYFHCIINLKNNLQTELWRSIIETRQQLMVEFYVLTPSSEKLVKQFTRKVVSNFDAVMVNVLRLYVIIHIYDRWQHFTTLLIPLYVYTY